MQNAFSNSGGWASLKGRPEYTEELGDYQARAESKLKVWALLLWTFLSHGVCRNDSSLLKLQVPRRIIGSAASAGRTVEGLEHHKKPQQCHGIHAQTQHSLLLHSTLGPLSPGPFLPTFLIHSVFSKVPIPTAWQKAHISHRGNHSYCKKSYRKIRGSNLKIFLYSMEPFTLMPSHHSPCIL